MRISDWSSDVCSSDLLHLDHPPGARLLDQVELDGAAVGARPLDVVENLAIALLALGLGDCHAGDACEHGIAYARRQVGCGNRADLGGGTVGDRKSTRLNPVTNAHLVLRLPLGKQKT